MNANQSKKIWDLAQDAYRSGNELAGLTLQSIATGLPADAIARAYLAMRNPAIGYWAKQAVQTLIKQ